MAYDTIRITDDLGRTRMPTREHMVAAIEEYCRSQRNHEKEAWLSLFSDDIVHEDPVGRTTNRGIENVAKFWEAFQPANPQLRVTAPPICCGNEAVVVMACTAGSPENPRKIDPIIDVFVFNEQGKIKNLRAFYAY
jgi:steroid Delta-isomerase